MERFYLILLITILTACSEPDKKEAAGAKASDSSVVSKQPDSSIPNGLFTKRYKDGSIEMTGDYIGGLKNGLWTSFYPNGKRWSECIYKEGIKNGPVSAWYDNGQKRYQGYFTKDVESGNWKFWDEKGNVLKEKDFGNNTVAN